MQKLIVHQVWKAWVCTHHLSSSGLPTAHTPEAPQSRGGIALTGARLEEGIWPMLCNRRAPAPLHGGARPARSPQLGIGRGKTWTFRAFALTAKPQLGSTTVRGRYHVQRWPFPRNFMAARSPTAFLYANID